MKFLMLGSGTSTGVPRINGDWGACDPQEPRNRRTRVAILVESEEGARLLVEGRIVEIGEGYFTLDGVVSISNAPDAGRECRADKTWHFAITRNRKYYRLREFEWCDGLTDYVDIYF